VVQLAAVLTAALAWHSAFGSFGSRLDRLGACTRFGAGSLLNAVAPARAGGALRFALFVRSLPGPGAAARGTTAVAAVGVARCVVVEAVAIAAVAIRIVPAWTAAVPFVPIVAIGVVAATARSRRWACRDGASMIVPREAAPLVGLAAGGTLCRLAAIAVTLAAVGVPRPVESALLAFVGLELGGLVPFVPGNAAAPLAAAALLAAHGLSEAQAARAAIEFHLVETAVGLVFGGVSVVLLARERRGASVPLGAPGHLPGTAAAS
jgi:uncharacterized membrane protein YbhN (UPF0104 family)